MLQNTTKLLDVIERNLEFGPGAINKNDLKDVTLEVLEDCDRSLGFAAIEAKLAVFVRTDLGTLKAVSLALREAGVTDKTLSLETGPQISAAEELKKFDEHIEMIDKNSARFGRIEILLRLELDIDARLERVLSCFVANDHQLPQKLYELGIEKISGLREEEISKIWSSIRAEFQPSQFREDAHLKVIPPIVDDSFFVTEDSTELPAKICDFILRIRPHLRVELQKRGQQAFYKGLLGPARLFSLHKHDPAALPTTFETSTLRCLSRVFVFWKEDLYGEPGHFLDSLQLDRDGLVSAGYTDDNLYEEKNKPSQDTGIRYRQFFSDLRLLVLFAERRIPLSGASEDLLWRYKLSREIAHDPNLTQKAHEIFLQRDLCKFLVEHGVYAYGKKFGRSEIDLLIEQPAEVFVIEAKRLKTPLRESDLEKYLSQLQVYIDQEPSTSRGILALFNFSQTRLVASRIWLKGRFWILAINLADITPSRTKSSITIEPGKNGKLFEFWQTGSSEPVTKATKRNKGRKKVTRKTSRR